MPWPEIDDEEFERLLMGVIDLWARHFDTAGMARSLAIPEAKAAYILCCLMDGKAEAREEEMETAKEQ